MTDGSAVQRLIDALELDEDAVALPTLDRVRAQIPAYEVVPSNRLLTSVHRNLGLACRTLRAGVVPPSVEIWQAEATTLERLQQGVPIEDIMGGFRVSIACIQDRLVELATDYQVGHAEVLSLTSLLWKLSDAFSARAASAYREQGLVLAVADQRRRDEWLSGLLAGSLSATQVDQGCLTYHVRRDMRLRAFCSGPLGEAALERAQHAILQQWAPQEDVRMMVPSNGHLIGIASSLPPVMRGLLLAAGPEDDIDRMPMSFAIAQGVLAAARLQFTDGIHTLETLGWRVAVPRVADVSDLVHLRYLQPLIDAGPFGVQVVKALRAYLANGRSIPRTAKALHVHVNTLRYQLARFEELTGWPLDETDTLVELSWALYASPLS